MLGRWPLLASESLFTPAMLDRAIRNRLDIAPNLAPVIGCDVARFGVDLTAIAVRLGQSLVHLETHARRDSTWIAVRLKELAHEYGGAFAHRVPLFIDGTGGYGAGVVDQLTGYDARDICFAASSPDPRFLRLRSYIWFRLSELALAGLLDLSRLPTDITATVRRDLISPRYFIDDTGRKVLEGKRQIKARTGYSPDVGDALALCYLGA